MGEVYRAEDKRLGGSVALKFLAPHAAADSEGLRRLLTEARLARQVTHPNVCRVFDVGEVDGHSFISMEFIDGETITSLLRRIGRLPSDKAISVAQQICAGLAWAHDRGILHRDLKPANIMLDGNGEVRIADFGLAGLARELEKDRHRAGTPAYMAPEVLRGHGATLRSDIFSLGLLLYEIFTGKPVYRPATIAELEALHNQPVSPPSTIVPDIHPQVERVIMRCLEHDPSLRPGSAREVAAALPGGDSLAAALNAGLTPSPRLVAAAGSVGTVGVDIIVYLAAAMIAAVSLALWLGQHVSMIERVPLNKSAAVLASTAETIVEKLGYPASTPYKAHGFDLYEEYLDLIAARDPTPNRWNRLHMSRPAAIDFWYRQSPLPLVTLSPDQRVSMSDPPFATADMISLRLDPKGRLRQFEYSIRAESSRAGDANAAAPPACEGSAASAVVPMAGDASATLALPAEPPDWQPMFELAGLNADEMTAIPPVRVPPVFADTRAAWEGVYPGSPQEPIRVEAASYLGKVVAFRIVEELWTEASIVQPKVKTAEQWAGTVLMFVVNAVAIVGAIILAWRNLRERIGDRDGAFRLATVMFAAAVLGVWLKADHPRRMADEVALCVSAVQLALPTALWFWVCYIAVEPYVRRLWPETLISWVRFMSGDIRNPLVGLHVAVGCTAGVVCACLAYLHRLSATLVNAPPPVPWIDVERGIDPLQGAAVALGAAFEIIPYATRFALTFLVTLLLLKFVVRKKWIAATAYAVIQATVWSLSRGDSILSPIFMSLIAVICTLLMVRYGLLGLVVGVISYLGITTFSPAVNLSHFSAPVALCALATLLVVFLLGLLCAGGAIAPQRVNTLVSGSSLG